MADKQPTQPDLTSEKLQLEIEELKSRIAESKKSKIWDDYGKTLIPVLITMIVAIWGYYTTEGFNKAQLEIAKGKNQSDKEIAQISASLSYIKTMTEISDSSKEVKEQAMSVIAPVLPPETAFDIAISALPDNQNILKILIEKYKSSSWKYITPYLEYLWKDSVLKVVDTYERNIAAPPISIGVDTFPPADTDNKAKSGQEKRERVYQRPFICIRSSDSIYSQVNLLTEFHRKVNFKRKYYLLSFLDQNQLLNAFEQYITSSEYQSNKRVYVLINYLDYRTDERNRDYNLNYSVNFEADKMAAKFTNLLNKINDAKLKQDIAFAGSYALGGAESNQSRSFIEYASQHFWDNYDVSIGEVPSNGSFEMNLWNGAFQYEYWKFSEHQSGAKFARESLLKRLLAIDFRDYKDIDLTAFRIFTSYSDKPQYGYDSVPYLSPVQTYEVMKKLLSEVNTKEQKRDMAFFIGSGSTIRIFEYIQSDSIVRKEFSRLLIDWYAENKKIVAVYTDIDHYVMQTLYIFSRDFPDTKEYLDSKLPTLSKK